MVPKATPSLLLENFRCFVAPREIPLAPLTFLVGGNSSGKTSFLAAVRLAWDAAASGKAPDFNKYPFELGSYYDIASLFEEEKGPANAFYLGLTLPAIKHRFHRTQVVKIKTVFCQSPDDYPLISEQIISGDDLSVVVRQAVSGSRKTKMLRRKKPFSAQITPKSDEGVVSATVNFPNGLNFFAEVAANLEPSSVIRRIELEYMRSNRKKEGTSQTLMSDMRSLHALARATEDRFRSMPEAFSPMRTRPKRTYDPHIPAFSPEGEHTPMVLSNLLQEDEKELGSLLNFGKKSGLFSNLKVRYLGNTRGDPFQVQVETLGYTRNFIDVGYGVSQSLPIVVGTMNMPRDAILLIQQPEVHLHPKAQAEMGTLFAEQMMQRSAPIIVETHSDYMIDRVRLMIRKGKIRKEDVRILFFSPQKTDVDIIPIELGDDGRIISPPDDYRKFFLDEQLEFFS